MLLVLKNTLAVIAPLGSGLLAGILVGTGMAQFTAQGLAESSWVMRFQLEDQLFAKAMPPLMLSTLVALIALFAVSGGHARWWLGASIAFTLLVLAITIGYEVPLNRQIQSWTPGAAPSDWGTSSRSLAAEAPSANGCRIVCLYLLPRIANGLRSSARTKIDCSLEVGQCLGAPGSFVLSTIANRPTPLPWGCCWLSLVHRATRANPHWPSPALFSKVSDRE